MPIPCNEQDFTKFLALHRFRSWAAVNREHLEVFVFGVPPDLQLEHERQCAVCKQGLEIAISCLTTEEYVEAVMAGVEVAKVMVAKGGKG